MFPGDFFSESNGCKQAFSTELSLQAPVYEPLNSRVESIIINCYGWKICTNFCHFRCFYVCFSTPLGRVILSRFIWCLPSLLFVGICLTHWLDKSISRREGLFGLASQSCSLHWRWDHEGLCLVQLTVKIQNKMNAAAQFSFFFLFCQFKSWDHGMVPHTFIVGLPFLVTLI